MSRPSRWVDVKLEFITKEAESEYEEDEVELRKSRLDANTVVLYYPSTAPDGGPSDRLVTLDIGSGCIRVEGTMQSVKTWVEM